MKSGRARITSRLNPSRCSKPTRRLNNLILSRFHITVYRSRVVLAINPNLSIGNCRRGIWPHSPYLYVYSNASSMKCIPVSIFYVPSFLLRQTVKTHKICSWMQLKKIHKKRVSIYRCIVQETQRQWHWTVSLKINSYLHHNNKTRI